MAPRMVLVAQARGGYKRVPLKGLRREELVRGRKVLWRRRRRYWKPGKIWRVTVGINYTWAHEYRSFTYQKYFDHEPSDGEVEDVKKEFLREFRAQTRVDYKPSEWWFGDLEDMNVEVAQIGYEKGLVGKSEWYDKSDLLKGFTKENVIKSMARKMIRSGIWFKQVTLDKWRWTLE